MGGVNPAAGATQAAKVARLHKAEARGGVPTALPQGVAGAEPRAHKPFAIPQLTKRHLLVTRRCELANQHLSEKHFATPLWAIIAQTTINTLPPTIKPMVVG